MHLRFTAHSETGPVRKNNQDSGFASTTLLVVADGMGGAAAGDLASAVAADEFRRLHLNGPEVTGDDMLGQLAQAITRSNDKIADLVAGDPNLDGMGTTVTAYMFDGHSIGIGHIGDSRGYLLRDGELRRTTHDHSWVQSLIDEGKITEEEAAHHPHRNLVLKVLNGQANAEPDLALLPVEPGDRLLLCSDGLCGLVNDDEIAEAMSLTRLPEVLDELIALAHEAGGIDNITVLLADVLPGSEHGATPSMAEVEQPEAAAAESGSLVGAELDEQVTATAAADEAGGPDEVGAEETLVRLSIGDRPPSTDEAGAEDPSGTRQDSGEFDVVDLIDADDDLPSEPILLGAATERSIPAIVDRTAGERTAGSAESGSSGSGGEDDEHERYAPTSPPRFRWVRPVIAAFVAVVVIGVGVFATNAWINSQYYVGVSQERVTIFRGLPDSVGGISLSQVYETTDTQIGDLPGYYRQRVGATIPAHDLFAARNTAEELRVAAQACIAQREAQTPLDPSTQSASPTPPGTTGQSPAPGSSVQPDASTDPEDQDSQDEQSNALTPTVNGNPTQGGDCE